MAGNTGNPICPFPARLGDRQVLTPEDFLFKSEPGEMAPLETLEDMEREMIRKALERHEGNLSAVASRLGITRQTLYNKMKKFNL